MPVKNLLIVYHNFCMTNSTIKLIQEKIKFYRTKKGLTQDKLSEMCHISSDYLSEIERGKKVPSLKRLLIIINVLDISLSEFFSNIK